MRRFFFFGLLGAIATAGACSLFNAPDDVIPGSGGSGGGVTPSAITGDGTATCQGGGEVLFSETFADNSKGWTLGPEWQIGQARASSGQTYGNPDPGADHTGEGGVAGVVIGGNASQSPTHPSEYLTSPPIDTTPSGPLYLTYYRWLNSDHTPYMTNTVEVSTDGATWTTLWQTGEMYVTDAAWTFQSIDVSPYRSAATQFRFGFSIGQAGVFRVSSWNLDQVEVQTAPCPG
jgi:hypothetical protein